MRRTFGFVLAAVTMADSDQLEVGDTVLAIGNPFGVGQTVTLGIVSAKERGMGLVDYEDFIQTDASINPGKSGGALVDAQGRLVGAATEPPSPVDATLRACVGTKSISEETEPIFCPSGYAANGIKCEGPYCDNMALYCCPYLNGIDENAQAQWSGYFPGYWNPENHDGFISSNGFVAGLRSSGAYSAHLDLYNITSPNLINTQQCYPAPSVSEEIGTGSCQEDEFVTGMTC